MSTPEQIEDTPFIDVEGLGETVEIVREYWVSIGGQRLGIKIEKYHHLSARGLGAYMGVPSHSIYVGDERYIGPGDGPYASPGLAARFLVEGYLDRIERAGGKVEWEPFLDL